MPKRPTEKADKRIKFDAAFRAEALRLAEQSRSVAAAARVLNIRAKLIYDWQKASLTPAAVAAGTRLDAATLAELRQLRADNRRQAQELASARVGKRKSWQAQELAILKKAIAIFSTPPTP